MGSRKVASIGTRAANRLFVGNLPWTVGHLELKKYFAQFGLVTQANVVFDKKTGLTKGFGFVQFSGKNGCSAATEVPTHHLEGNTLTVRTATV